MSSFFCSEQCFSSVARLGLRWGMTDPPRILVQDVARLNLEALSQKYEDYDKNTELYQKTMGEILKMYYLGPSERTRIQDCYTAHGWLYQCTEGNVPNTYGYRRWEGLINLETIFLANTVRDPLEKEINDPREAFNELERYCEDHNIETKWGD